MGLLDVLNGMAQGPRGPSTSTPSSSQSGGMSPLTMALLGLLAWKNSVSPPMTNVRSRLRPSALFSVPMPQMIWFCESVPLNACQLPAW